jgi:hypothetical protein
LLNEPVDLQPRPVTQNISHLYKSLTATSVTEHTTHHLGSESTNPKNTTN